MAVKHVLKTSTTKFDSKAIAAREAAEKEEAKTREYVKQQRAEESRRNEEMSNSLRYNNSLNRSKSEEVGKTFNNVNVQDQKNTSNGITDGGKSSSILSSNVSVVKKKSVKTLSDPDFFDSILHTNNIYNSNDIDLFTKTYRFGVFDPNKTLSKAKEFLFFTKPDLNIYSRDNITGLVNKSDLSTGLKDLDFWKDMINTKGRIIQQLQDSAGGIDKFNHLLQNQCISNLEIPGLNSEVQETASNIYGVSISYRGSSEESDDNLDFSLEFRDTKWLDTYYFFKAYEEYETLKHHGTVSPWRGYIERKVLHDQFSIYKILVDQDMETILYYGKMYGVMPKSLPRDVFSTDTFDNGISYSIDFKAAFYEDMQPHILSDFNALSYPFYSTLAYPIDIYNQAMGRSDGRPAKAAYVVKETNTARAKASPNGYVYVLKWRGSDKY